ncbi:LPS assembly lipoprotein LptE [Gammaproteobacteria bacterium]|jgi:LPS-assembly lipoprotein|nr:LPS assembly lipoprotein LptE [Gammaproteobacteria bacterium]|tara:strand:+ start:708 stop:1205 length:498 start_codon:yes stop_codon:yes gene_type:complete
MKTRLILIYTLLLTTACGFHLRGSQLNGFDISNLYINSSSAPRLTKEVKSQLIGLNKSLASSSQGAAYIITLKDERFEKSVLSVSAKTGKVEEYQIVLNVEFNAAYPDGSSIIENDRVRVTRDFIFDENDVLGKFSEEGLLEDDLIRSAASKVLRRLQALLPDTK